MTLAERETRTLQHVKYRLLLQKFCYLLRQAMVDAELMISIQSKTLVMIKPMYNLGTGTLSKTAQNERAHLATAWLSGIDINVGNAKHGGGVVSKRPAVEVPPTRFTAGSHSTKWKQ